MHFKYACNSLLMWLSGCKRIVSAYIGNYKKTINFPLFFLSNLLFVTQIFTRLNQLNICTGIKAAHSKVDSIKRECVKELDNWKLSVSLQSENQG